MNKVACLFFLVVFLVHSGTAHAFDEKMLETKYLPLFEQIEKHAITSLNALMDEAYIEYEKKKANKELTLPVLFKYIEKGNTLEKEVDQAFQALLLEMKHEATTNGLSETLVQAYEKHYIKSKRKNKLQILKNITVEGHTINFEREY